MDRMIHVALNSLQNLRLDQRINAQNLANMNVAGFRKDLPASRSSAFLGNMEQFESRYFVTASDKMEFSREEGLVRRTEGKLDFALRGPGDFFIDPKSGMPPALSPVLADRPMPACIFLPLPTKPDLISIWMMSAPFSSIRPILLISNRVGPTSPKTYMKPVACQW